MAVLKHLYLHCGAGGRILLPRRYRHHTAPLWRRGLIEVWRRISPSDNPLPHGPFYSLTIDGGRLASSLVFASELRRLSA